MENKNKIASFKKQLDKLHNHIRTFDFLVLEHLAKTVRHEYILKNREKFKKWIIL